MINNYNNFCVEFYFGTWMLAHEKVQMGEEFPWQGIMEYFDRRYL